MRLRIAFTIGFGILALAGGFYVLWHGIASQGVGVSRNEKLLAEVPLHALPADKPQGFVSRRAQPFAEPRTIPASSSHRSVSVSQTLPSQAALVPPCVFGTAASPVHGPVTLNEIAWMGSVASAQSEWIELRNNAQESVSLRGWHLLDQGGQIAIVFGEEDVIPAGGFYLLERGSDESVPGAHADAIYAGVLGNVAEGVRLFNSSCELQDEVFAKPEWPGGDNETKRTLERNANGAGWHTSVGNGGTPKAENSVAPALSQSPFPEHTPSPIPSQTPSSAPAPTSTPSPSQTPSSSPTPTPTPSSLPQSSPASNANHILISEIQLTGGAHATTNDFIELYNPNGQSVDLSGWKLRKRTQSGSESSISVFPGGSVIPAHGFFLWASSDDGYGQSIDANVTTSQNLAANNSVALMDANSAVVDTVVWGENLTNPFAGNPIAVVLDAHQSYERKAWENGSCVSASGNGAVLGNGCDTDVASDFEMRAASEPQNAQSPREP